MLTTQNAFAGRKWSLVAALLISLTFAFTACKKADNTTPTLSTIGDLVNTGSKFTLLKAALVRTGLDATLAQPGTYTVFAPTDDAFKAFGYGDAASINAAPVQLLTTVIKYHVLGTRVAAADIPTAINTVQQTSAGLPLYVSKVASATGTSTTISVNGAHIFKPTDRRAMALFMQLTVYCCHLRLATLFRPFKILRCYFQLRRLSFFRRL